MKIISHRGNLNGRITDKENNPSYIQEAIDYGCEVEVDVWYVNDKFYLGHDAPQYSVSESWLNDRRDVLWCHAKNTAALQRMIEIGLHCFWHETDRFTLTNRGIPWCYPKNHIRGGIVVVFDVNVQLVLPADILGVCTDEPNRWRKS
jgi:hypothetical protein